MKPFKVFKVEITLTLTYSVVGWLIFEKLISMNCKSNIKCFFVFFKIEFTLTLSVEFHVWTCNCQSVLSSKSNYKDLVLRTDGSNGPMVILWGQACVEFPSFDDEQHKLDLDSMLQTFNLIIALSSYFRSWNTLKHTDM